MANKKSMSLDKLKDRFIGKEGSEARDNYEMDLTIDVIGTLIKEARIKQNMTQEQLGDLIGVQKAQISKLESNATNVTLATLIKVFKAMNAKLKLNVELESAA